MKLILSTAIITASLLSHAHGATTQPNDSRSTQNSKNPTTYQTPDSSTRKISSHRGRNSSLEKLGRPVRAEEILGKNVTNLRREEVGEIEDLLVDVDHGRIAAAIVQVGGFLGMGSRYVAVPAQKFRVDSDQNALQLDVSKQTLIEAPPFDSANWSRNPPSDQLASIYRHYGAKPYFDSGSRRVNFAGSAKEIIGSTVHNLQDQKVGRVHELIVDLPAGRVVEVVLSSGGFLGMGDALSVLPPSALRFNAHHDALLIDATPESLAKAPRFNEDEWPKLGDPEYATRVYRSWGTEPYFSPDTDVDNTAYNVRDRDGRSLTPADQSNDKNDIAITSQIRREINARDDLSLNARNVKIITTDGEVTLRGPVNSSEEKRLLGEIAANVAPADRVNNQLEVKSRANRR